jgi:hypothetical protein
VKLKGTPGKIQGFSPFLGERTVEILQKIGYKSKDIVGMEQQVIIKIDRVK